MWCRLRALWSCWFDQSQSLFYRWRCSSFVNTIQCFPFVRTCVFVRGAWAKLGDYYRFKLLLVAGRPKLKQTFCNVTLSMTFLGLSWGHIWSAQSRWKRFTASIHVFRSPPHSLAWDKESIWRGHWTLVNMTTVLNWQGGCLVKLLLNVVTFL